MRSHVVSWLSQFMPDGIAASIAPSWFSCVGLAGVVGMLVMLVIARRRGVETGIVASVVLWCYLAAVIAGIVVPMMIDGVEQLISTGHVRLRWSGMTSFWGYLAGGIAVAIVCRRHEIPLAKLGDMAAIPMGVALVFARLGCFLGGCDYGKVTSVPWAVRFPSGSPAWRDHLKAGLLPPDRLESLPVHPTQLYEALLGIVIIGVAMWAARQKWRDGRVFLAAAATYAVGRIVVEVFRGDLGRGIYFGLSSGQIFSLCVLVAIAAGLALTRTRLVGIAASAAVALALFEPHPANAQPYAPPYAPPYATPEPAETAPAPAPAPSIADAPAVREARTLHLSIGLLGGLAVPLNRRSNQVSALAGPSLSVGFTGSLLGVWMDLDSLGNRDASHGTLLFSGGVLPVVAGGKLRLGGRMGVGPTLVNFDEPAFQDVTGVALRFEAIGELALGGGWRISMRPLSIDVLTARDLGGPITTWQTRVGIAYAFDFGRKATTRRDLAPPPQQPPPYSPPYQPPYPQPVSRNP
ncbi:hypothetical protein BH11MYX3_BH11MYX3_47550 [soil metagenome]